MGRARSTAGGPARGGWRWGLVLAALLCAWAAGGGLAAQADIALKASQESVTTEVGSPTTIAVVASGAPAGARLELIADRGVRATARKRGGGRWLLGVGAGADLAGDGLLTLELRDRSGRPLASTQVRVAARPKPAADALAQATLIFDREDLVEGNDLRGFLSVANRSEQTLAVGVARVVAAPGIDLEMGGLPGLVLPGRTLVVPIVARVSGTAPSMPGKHVVGLVVPLSSDLTPAQAAAAGASAGRRGLHAEILTTRELDVSVPGVSAVTGVLQIPSLLLLPGLLAVASFFAIASRARPRPVGEDPLARLALVLSPALWIIMIMLSGGIAILYRLLSGRNVLYAYGLRDVVWLWFGSIIAGGIAGWIAAGAEKRRRARAAAPRFRADATPIDVLQQLVQEQRPWRMRSKQAGGAQLFDLGVSPEGDRVWACGLIVYRLVGQAGAAAVRDAVLRRDVGILRAQLVAGAVTLTFKPYQVSGERIAGPRLVSPDLFEGITQEDELVQEGP